MEKIMPPSKKNNMYLGITAGIAVIAVGIILIRTLAGGPFVSLEAEQGVMGGSAKVIADSTASAGKAAQFADASTPTAPKAVNLDDPAKKEIAMQLVSSAENSSLDWKAEYGYIEYNVEGNEAENRGYTGGIIGFTSKTSDMLALVQYYNKIAPDNPLTPYISALQKVDRTSSKAGLGDPFVAAWKQAAKDPKFQQAQNDERDRVYFNPAVSQGKADGIGALGQFIYYDALVVHGPGSDSLSFGGIRATAIKKAKTPAQGGDQKTYLSAFLDARTAAMQAEEAHSNVTRISTAQRVFLNANNFNLDTPLSWKVYGDSYTIK